MKKCFFIIEVVPFLITLFIIFLESLIKKNLLIADDSYLFLMVIPTIIIYFLLLKIFKKLEPSLKEKGFCE